MFGSKRPPLYCAEALELADLIDKIKGAPERELDRIYSAQIDYEKRIFAPLDEAQIKNDLASVGG